MNWETQKSQAIPFIVKDQSDNYTLTPQAQSFLSTLNGPLSIISVAGLYRTGKSYLLNRVILNRSSGFGVGPSVNPCTKGLWLWAEPIKVAEGRTMLVIDTEGLGALDEQNNHDMKIFSLAVLLSTNFIYNSVGSIDQTALQTLSLALQLISTIDKDNYSSRPSLLWVIRDFSLQLINDNGVQITSRQYLQLALSTEHLKETQKVQLRKIINQAFSQRDCFTMIKPLIDEQKLQALDKISPDELRPQFVSQTITLRKSILNSLRDMKLNNSGPLNGKQYAIMVKKYLTAINAGQVPNLSDTWTFIREQKARNVVQTVRQNYDEKLRTKLGSRLPISTNKLEQILANLRKQASEQFLKDSYEQTVHEDLLQFLNACEKQMLKVNAKQTKNALNDLMRRQFEPFQKKLLSEYYSDIGSYENDLRITFTKTLPQKIENKIDISITDLELFTERRVTEAAKIFERRAREEASKAKQMKSETENILQTELRNLGRSSEEERRKYQEELLNMERKIIGLSSQKQKIQSMLEKERKDEALETQRLRKRAEQNQGTLQTLQTEVKRLSITNSEQEKTLFGLKKELQKQKALSCQKQQYMSNKLEQQENKIKKLSQQYEKQYRRWQNEKKQMIGAAEAQSKILALENKQCFDQIQELTQLLEEERRLRCQSQQEIEKLKSKHQDDIIHYKQKLLNSNKKQNKKDDEQVNKKNQITQNLIKAQKELKQWQLRHKQQCQQLKQAKSNFENDLAIYKQKIQFQQIQISQLRNKNNELNESYQRYLENVNSDNQGIEQSYTRKIFQITQEHKLAIDCLTDQYENKIRQLKKQNKNLNQFKEDLELQLSRENKRANDTINELRENLKKTEKSFRQVSSKLSTVEKNQTSTLREKDHFYETKIQQLQNELESIAEKSVNQLNEYNKKTEKNIIQLKNYAEQQRKQLERRLQEEKDRSNRKIGEINQEFNKRLAEEKEMLENIIEELNQKLEITERDANEQIQAMRTDYQIKMQKMGNSAIEQRMDLNKRIALISQEAQMTKSNLLSQLQQKTKMFQHTLQTKTRQMNSQFEQQLRMIKEALEQSESRNDALRKANRKAQQTNLLLKSQIDKDKALYKEKIQNGYKQRRELEQRYLTETEAQNRAIQQLNSYSNQQTRRLNGQIQKLRHRIAMLEDENMKAVSGFQEEKKAFENKIVYLEAKVKRSKNDHDDLLVKFDKTVKALTTNNKSEYEREHIERNERLKEQYNRSLKEKQENMNSQRKQMQDKMLRLQTQNKTLRDKVLIFEMRENTKKGKVEDIQNELYKQRNYYERQIHQLKRELQKSNNRSQRPSQRDIQSNIKLDRSKISDRSERFSYVSDYPLDTSNRSALRQNKSVVNNRPSITVKKQNQEKRYMNIEDVTGVMKWNH